MYLVLEKRISSKGFMHLSSVKPSFIGLLITKYNPNKNNRPKFGKSNNLTMLNHS